MPVFVEDPRQLSKSRLKADLVAHSVALPSDDSKKRVYVDLHLKHIDHKGAADFSSDEEDLATPHDDVAEETKHSEDPEMQDPSGLTDDELRAALVKCGVNIGPITATTRALYERRLIKALQADAQPGQNGTADAALYSDSEEEVDGEEDSSSEQVVQEPDSSLDQTQPENPRFSIPPQHREGSAKRNVGNVVESSSSQRIQSPHSQIASGFSTPVVSVHQPSALEPALPEEPVTVDEPVTELSADTAPAAYSSPPGIIVTRRRPIKGAAGRPVIYKYPDTLPLTPVSPTTAERQELESRLVPMWVRILVFVVVLCLLVLIYAYVNDDSLFVSLLDSLSQGSEEERLTLAEDTPITPITDLISGQE